MARGRRRSASRAVPLTRWKTRAIFEGGKREGRTDRSARPPNWAGLVRRLRRIELALVSLLTPELVSGMKIDLDSLSRDMLRLRNDAGGEDGGEALSLLRKRGLQGQAERDHGADGGLEGPEDEPWPFLPPEAEEEDA